jgi:L-rhamnose isomerase
MKNVEVGMFRLPGISFDKGELPPELNKEMIEWAKAEGVGMSMTESLWSFRKEAHREWFILRWVDSIPKPEKEEE